MYHHLPRVSTAAAIRRVGRRGCILATLGAALAMGGPARAANVVLVISGSTINSSESARRTSFQGWGHTVTTIQDSSSQASFDSAAASADVVYVPATIQDWELLYKLRTAACGVVTETPGLDTEFGFTTSDGYTESGTQVLIVDNSHEVSTGFANGVLTILSSQQSVAPNGNTLAAGLQKLGERNYGTLALGAMEAGGTLANTYNGNSTASGRRVRMPWADITWSALNSNGLKIAQQALAWAAGGSGELVLHWKLDETSGTALIDSAGGNDATFAVGAPARISAVRNNGLQFNGGNSADTDSQFDPPQEGAVAFWFRPDSTPAGTERLFGISDSWEARITSSGLLVFDISLGAGPSTDVAVTSSGEWRHVVYNYDAAADTYEIYLDGELHKSGSLALSDQAAGTLSLGTRTGSTEYYAGSLDDFRVYSRQLTAAEVAEVHGLIAHWKLDESTGTTANDSSLANNDATLTGTQGWTTGEDNGGHNFNYMNGEEYFTAPSNTALDDVQEGDYTVMAYFNPNSIPPGTGSDNDAQYSIVAKNGWHAGIFYNNAGEFQVEHFLSGNTWVGTATWGESFATGSFHHVAGVVNRTDGTVKIYVDGVLKNTSTFTAGAAARDYGTARWRIGMGYPGGGSWGQPCDGVIDDARIYNRALSDEEIAQYAKGLVAHWKLDETSGTALVDSAGANDAAFAVGAPARISAVRDNGLQFSGGNSADSDLQFDPPQQGSLAFWFRCDSTPAGTERLLGISDSWEARISSSGLLYFDVCIGSGPSTDAVVTSPRKWRHVAYNYDATADTYEIYLDGQFHKSGSLALSDHAAGTLSFGTRTGSTEYFAGSLDDVRVYSRQLTAAEVAEVYGLVGHWSFDEGTGASLADGSGMGNDGAFQTGAPAWISGMRSAALEFDGTNDAITASDFAPPSEGTVAFWMRSDGTPSSTQRLWGLGGDYEVRQGTDGLLAFDVSTQAQTGSFVTTEPVDEAGAWRHVAATYDADDDSYAIYLDGELHASGISVNPVTQQAAGQLSFGTRTGTTDRFSGALDDFRIYNRKLSQSEIYEIFGLKAWYKLDETSGTTAVDATGLGNDGAFVGSPTLGVTSNGGPGMGTAVDFNGSNYVEIPSLVATTSSLSVAGWAKLDTKDASGAELVSLGDHFLLRLDDGGNATRASYYDGSSWTGVNASGQMAKAGWHHFAAVLTQGESIKVYVDGNEAATAAIGSPISFAGLGSVTRIGRHGDAGTDFDFDGRIDDVRIYDRRMSPEEVYDLYRGSRIDGIKILQWVETR